MSLYAHKSGSSSYIYANAYVKIAKKCQNHDASLPDAKLETNGVTTSSTYEITDEKDKKKKKKKEKKKRTSTEDLHWNGQ